MSSDRPAILLAPAPGSPSGRSGVALNERQRRFVQEYLKYPVAAQAAVRAGYSARTAEWIGPQLLKKEHVAAAVQVAQDQRAERVGVDADRVLAQVACIALADPRRLVDEKGRFLPLHELPDDIAMAVSSVEVTKDGSLKYRLWDKNSALEKAMKHLGLYERDNKQKTDPFTEMMEFLRERGSRIAPDC